MVLWDFYYKTEMYLFSFPDFFSCFPCDAILFIFTCLVRKQVSATIVEQKAYGPLNDGYSQCYHFICTF